MQEGERKLDFSPIDALIERGRQKRKTAAEDSSTAATQRSPEELGALADIKLTRAQEDRQNSIEMFKTYQDNIRRSDQIREELMRGVRSGERAESLFLKAVRAISLMTGDSLFYEQIEKDIRSIWGEGCLSEIPLEWEIAEIEERVQNMREALKSEDMDPRSRERVMKAVSAHTRRMDELRGRLEEKKRRKAEREE